MLKYLVWLIISKLVMGVIYVAIIAEGLRQLVPALGQRIYKLPGLGFLQYFEETYRLDLAPFMALFILLSVFYTWERILLLYLGGEDGSVRETLLLVVIGIVILGADGFLFYAAMSQMGWNGKEISVPAVLATICYVAILVWLSFVTVTMRMSLKERRKCFENPFA